MCKRRHSAGGNNNSRSNLDTFRDGRRSGKSNVEMSSGTVDFPGSLRRTVPGSRSVQGHGRSLKEKQDSVLDVTRTVSKSSPGKSRSKRFKHLKHSSGYIEQYRYILNLIDLALFLHISKTFPKL